MGSEMCIRDSINTTCTLARPEAPGGPVLYRHLCNTHTLLLDMHAETQSPARPPALACSTSTASTLRSRRPSAKPTAGRAVLAGSARTRGPPGVSERLPAALARSRSKWRVGTGIPRTRERDGRRPLPLLRRVPLSSRQITELEPASGSFLEDLFGVLRSLLLEKAVQACKEEVFAGKEGLELMLKFLKKHCRAHCPSSSPCSLLVTPDHTV